MYDVNTPADKIVVMATSHMAMTKAVRQSALQNTSATAKPMKRQERHQLLAFHARVTRGRTRGSGHAPHGNQTASCSFSELTAMCES